MSVKGEYKIPAPGSLIIDEEDMHLLQKLDFLNGFNVFIIQKKTEMDCFSSNVTHEIMDHRRNVILKATRSSFSKCLLRANRRNKDIVVRNRRNVKLFGIAVEPTNNLSNESEATIFISPKKRIAHIEKYEGLLGPPSFEIFNIEGNTAFTSDPSAKKTPNVTMVEYDVCNKAGRVANIMMKTGLNFILSTEANMKTMEKATLLSAVLAMDILHTGTRAREPSVNQYTPSI